MKLRIETGKAGATGTRTRKGKPASRSESSTESSTRKLTFQEHVDQIIPPDGVDQKTLNELIGQLPDVEKDLIEKRSDSALLKYKELIRSIVNMTLKLNTEVKTIVRNKKNGDKVYQSYVNIIDQRLYDLTTKLTSPASTAFQILKQMEEIRGILLDMRS
jgi:uncharacterized protein YaaR (DUF327 family)